MSPARQPSLRRTSARRDPLPALLRWHRVNRMMALFIAVGVLCIVAAKVWPEIVKLNQLQVRTQVLEIREAQLRTKRDLLKKEYLRLRDDPEYLELVARDRLDLMKPGETIFRFVDSSAAP